MDKNNKKLKTRNNEKTGLHINKINKKLASFPIFV